MTHTNPHDGPYDPMDNPEVAHEDSDVNVRAILMSGAGLLIVGVIVHVLMWWLFAVFERQAAANDPQTSPLAVPATDMPTTTASPYFGTAAAPQLLTNEPAVLLKHRATEQQQLQTGGWVNQAGGVARIRRRHRQIVR